MSHTSKTNIILWSSLAASAAGIVALAVAMRYQRQHDTEGRDKRSVASRLRDVQDVLTDCYDKINEIESHLPSVLSDRFSRASSASIANAPQN